MTDKMIAALPVAEQELYANVPAWVTAVFAIAVFGGALGSIVLLARKKIATTIFTISFVAIIAQMIYNFFLSNTMEVYGPGGMIMPIMVIIIGIFLIWYAKYSTKKEWLS
jgi:predicted permease